MIVHPNHQFLVVDQNLAEKGMELLNTLLPKVPLSQSGDVHRLRVVVQELQQRATIAVEAHKKENETSAALQVDRQMDYMIGFLGSDIDIDIGFGI
jgi:uncharacterized Zn finger protein